MAINEGLRSAFGEDDSPYEIATRLLEETGEPDRMAMAKEIQDLIRCALQMVCYYDLDDELDASVEQSYQQHLENELTQHFD